MRWWQGTIQLLTHKRVRVCARAANLVLLWPAVTNTCSSTTSRQCHQAYDHSSPPLLAAPLRRCERRSLLAAPSSLPRFAAPIASSPRRPSSPLPPASASLAILHRAAQASSTGPRRPRPPPPARAGLALLHWLAQDSPRFAGPRRSSSLPSPCAARARALVPAHSCQRADNVLFWPAVTSPPFSLRCHSRHRRSPSPPRSAALPVAAAPHRRQGPPPSSSPSPLLPIAAKVRRPLRRRIKRLCFINFFMRV